MYEERYVQFVNHLHPPSSTTKHIAGFQPSPPPGSYRCVVSAPFVVGYECAQTLADVSPLFSVGRVTSRVNWLAVEDIGMGYGVHNGNSPAVYLLTPFAHSGGWLLVIHLLVVGMAGVHLNA
ncbi:hypothetical protein PENSPDRAFT_671712 [Peniophora sp. CONT]|nr:hypothetical protein PENSPDRAFT_671712 [Peniophora sp. CONT]